MRIYQALVARLIRSSPMKGPGQGSIIREQGVPFTAEWEKPTAAILDEYLQTHPLH